MIAQARNLFVNYMHTEEKNISLSLFIPPVKRLKQISLGMPVPAGRGIGVEEENRCGKIFQRTDFLSRIFVIH